MFIINFNIQEENKTKIIAEEISKICKKGDVLAVSGAWVLGRLLLSSILFKKLQKLKVYLVLLII